MFRMPFHIVVLLVACSSISWSVDDQADVLEVFSDITLDPQRAYGKIVVKKSGITIEGQGAWLIGSTGADTKSYQGTAISADGVARVTLRNVNAKGWETALHIRNAEGWLVEGCNFSDNFHDPGFGWGENGRRGGILLEKVRTSTLRKNTAQRVWDACVLVDSDDTTAPTVD